MISIKSLDSACNDKSSRCISAIRSSKFTPSSSKGATPTSVSYTHLIEPSIPCWIYPITKTVILTYLINFQNHIRNLLMQPLYTLYIHTHISSDDIRIYLPRHNIPAILPRVYHESGYRQLLSFPVYPSSGQIDVYKRQILSKYNIFGTALPYLNLTPKKIWGCLLYTSRCV